MIQKMPGQAAVRQYRGHKLLLQIPGGAEQHGVEDHADKNAFAPVLRAAVMKLPGIDKNAVSRVKPGDLTVDIVEHMAGKHGDQFNIVVPVADRSIVGIGRQNVPFYIDRKAFGVVLHLFGTVRIDK